MTLQAKSGPIDSIRAREFDPKHAIVLEKKLAATGSNNSKGVTLAVRSKMLEAR